MSTQKTTQRPSAAADKTAQTEAVYQAAIHEWNYGKPKVNWDQFCWDEATKASEIWFREQSQNPYASLYLYYRCGELGVFSDARNGWTLGSGERLSPALTRQQVAAKIHAISQCLPFLPIEKEAR